MSSPVRNVFGQLALGGIHGPGGNGGPRPAWDDLVRGEGLPFISGARWMRCFWDAFGDGNRSLRVLDGLLESSDVLDLGPVRPGAPVLAGLTEAAGSRHLPVVENAAGGDAIIDLREPWADFRRSMSQNLENARRPGISASSRASGSWSSRRSTAGRGSRRCSRSASG